MSRIILGTSTGKGFVKGVSGEYVELAESARGAESNKSATTDPNDMSGMTFGFHNTNGFGAWGANSFIRVWNYGNQNDGHYVALVPSRTSKQLLGLANFPWKAVYANEFIGKASRAEKFNMPDDEDLNVSEYEITETGLYLVVLGNDSVRHTDIICIQDWAMEAGEEVEVIGNYVKFSGSDEGGIGYLQPYNDAGNIRFVAKLSTSFNNPVG